MNDAYEPEYLGVVPLGDDLVLHAIYPSARRTLCLTEPVLDNGFWQVDPKRTEPVLFPDCQECWRVIAEWQPIKGSGIPKSWHRLLRAARAA